MFPRARFLGLLAVLLWMATLAGCGKITRAKDVAADAMDQFHERFNAGDFDKIYDTADADFQRASGRSEFLKFSAAVHRKLGDYKKCENTGWNVNSANSDTSVTLHYKTTFTKGTGDEEFIYKVSGSRATLRGYHINSTTLVTE